MIRLEIPNERNCILAAKDFFTSLVGEKQTEKSLNGVCVNAVEEEPLDCTEDMSSNTLVPGGLVKGDGWKDEPQLPPVPTNKPPEFDSAGVEWNESFHTKTKGRTIDGKWKQRKGLSVDEKLAKQNYEASFVNPNTLSPKPASTVPPLPNTGTLHGAAIGTTTQGDFNDLMTLVTDIAINPNSKLDENGIARILSLFTPNGLPDMANHPEQIPTLMEALSNANK